MSTRQKSNTAECFNVVWALILLFVLLPGALNAQVEEENEGPPIQAKSKQHKTYRRNKPELAVPLLQMSFKDPNVAVSHGLINTAVHIIAKQRWKEFIVAGNVISQNPTGGSSVPSGMAVDLVISDGPAPPPVIYVDDDATGANNGLSWEDAFTSLQDALAVAMYGDEIRVAQGTYRPNSVEPMRLLSQEHSISGSATGESCYESYSDEGNSPLSGYANCSPFYASSDTCLFSAGVYTYGGETPEGSGLPARALAMATWTFKPANTLQIVVRGRGMYYTFGEAEVWLKDMTWGYEIVRW